MDDFVRLDYLYSTYKSYAKRVKEIRALLEKSSGCDDHDIIYLVGAFKKNKEMKAKYYTLFVSELVMIDDDEEEDAQYD